jgi:hypothetical protein
MNGFATVPKGVICFLILTDLTRFCWVLCDWSYQVLGEIFMDEGIRSSKSLSLGMPKAPQGNILRRLKHLSLGMSRMASPLYSTNHRYFTWSYIFIRHMICVLLGASCMIWVFAFYFVSSILTVHTNLREPKLCYDLLEWLICFT